ncbi:MAG: LacI family transcriptional regulator [Actinobacteria bacterium HGW-Actinobacteria-4]|nr:MAG: LacI family transcriptional regulator [Actinobacteria bacterium HGW-Actinobacteria-4]
MHDVAALAGVSHQTVSRVLNDFAGVKPDTRERVTEAINALGYRRNLAARTLATGRSQSIGVLAPEVPNFGPMASLAAVERAAREAGFYSLVISTTPEPARVAEALDYLLGKSIDALVLMAQQRSVVDAVTSTAVGLPIVYLLTGGESSDWAVSVDQGAGVDIAVQHLIDLGHRRIQHIAGPIDFSEARLRRLAFDRIVAAHGLDSLPLLIGDWTADSGYAAALALDPTATAVFCANDQMAVGAIHALVDSGRRVPEEVSVVGFDDLPEAKHSLPPLTTVHQDFEGVGHRAMEVLLARLNEQGCPTIDPFVPWLVERASTAPPRTNHPT